MFGTTIADASGVYGRAWTLRCGGCICYGVHSVTRAAWCVLMPTLHSASGQPKSVEVEIPSNWQLGITGSWQLGNKARLCSTYLCLVGRVSIVAWLVRYSCVGLVARRCYSADIATRCWTSWYQSGALVVGVAIRDAPWALQGNSVFFCPFGWRHVVGQIFCRVDLRTCSCSIACREALKNRMVVLICL